MSMRVDFYTMSYIIPLVASVAASPLRGFTQTALLARAANLAFLDSASCTFSSLTASTSSHQIDRRSHASDYQFVHPGLIALAAQRHQQAMGSSSHSADTSLLSRTEIRRMRVADLREELGRRGMSTAGLREALVARLLDLNASGAAAMAPTKRSRSSKGTSTPHRLDGDAHSLARSEESTSSSASVRSDDSSSRQLSPDETYVLRFDGGSRGNPGVAGAGMVLYDANTASEVWCGRSYIGDSYTNNEAEYTALLDGLRGAFSMGARHIVVQGDSQLIVKQIEGEYRVKSEKLRPFYQEAIKLLGEFSSFQISHIPRADNARADELANEAMDARESDGRAGL